MSKSSNKTTRPQANKPRSNKPGPFKPTVHVPRNLPVALPSPPTAKVAPGATSLASEGMLQNIGREADEALAIGKRVLGMLNVESKALKFATTNVSVDYSGLSYSPLASITQGDTDSMRDGDSLKVKGFRGKLQFTRGGTDSIVSFCFTQEGPTFISATQQVYEGAGTVNAPISQPMWDSRFGFRRLKTQTRALTQNDPFWIIDFDHHFDHDVQFYNNSTTVYEGKVSLFLISNYTGGGPPTISFDSEIYWVDN